MSEQAVSPIMNYEEALVRFSGHQELLSKYVKMFLEQKKMDLLQEAMQEKDYEKAFLVTHDMKSATGNLGFSRLYEKICELTELLREGKDIPSAILFYPEVKDEYQTLLKQLLQDSRFQ